MASRLARLWLAILGMAIIPAVRPMCAQAPPAETVLWNARFWTGESGRPYVEAVAIRGDRIVATGSPADVETAVGPHAAREDLNGAFVVPGFIDTHTHFNRAGALLMGVNHVLRTMVGGRRVYSDGAWRP